MLDRIEEFAYYGRIPLPMEGLTRVVCLAPHPDDEVLGCGGLMAMLTLHGRDVRTIVLTDGQTQPGLSKDGRQAESIAAAKCLGLGEPEFWGFEDRALRYNERLVQRLVEVLQPFCPTHLLLPSLSEPHPDHQAVSLAGMAASYKLGCDLLFYEAAAPMVPSHLVDISSVLGLKTQAMTCFVSQQGFQDYRLQAQALGQLRAHGFPGPAQAVEAYFLLTHQDLLRSGPAAARCDVLSTRQRLGLAMSPSELPLVSVIVRTIGRPSLQEALDSIAAQTYPAIETVLVDARTDCLSRSGAANEGLSRARGEFALFLDDDDLIEPGHVSRLLTALSQQPSAVVAYGGVRVLNSEGVQIAEYDEPWSLERLTGANYIPIHAALFRFETVRKEQVQFRSELPVLEDWSFWLDLAAYGPFVHCSGVSATYRKLDAGSGLTEPQSENFWEDWHIRILEERTHIRPLVPLTQALAWHGRALAQSTQRVWELNQKLARAQSQYEESTQALLSAKEKLAQGYERQLQELLASRETLALGYEQQLKELLTSRENLTVGYEQQLKAVLDQRQALSDALTQERARLSSVLGTRLWRWSKPLRLMLNRLSGRSID